MRTLVQKQSGGLFLGRGKIHGLVNAPDMGVGTRPFANQMLCDGLHIFRPNLGENANKSLSF